MRRPSDRKSSLLLTSSTRNNETGAVLVIGLMFLAILALVGSTAVVLTSTDLKISANYKSSTQAFSAAQAGIEEARGRMRGNTDSSIRIPDPILTYDRTDYSWETYIGTDILAQNLSGYDPGDTIKNSIHSFPDIDYAVQILHALDDQDLDGDGVTDEVLYWGDSDGDGDLERHTDAAKNHPNIYLITGYGSAAGANNMVQMEVTRIQPIPIKAALYTDIGADLRGSVEIDGNDMCGGSNKPGVATPLSYIDADEPIDPPPHPENVMGSVGTSPDVDYDVDPIPVHSIVASHKKSADFSYPGGGIHTGTTTPGPGDGWGTPDLDAVPPTCSTYSIIYYDSDIKFTSTVMGCGILLVNGNLELAGGFNWYGTVVVAGSLDASGNVKIRGAVLTAGDTAIDEITGNVDLAYCSSATEGHIENLPLTVLTWKQLLSD